MKKFEWQDEFNINIDEIDKYYKEIIKNLNKTIDLILANEERKKITTSLMNVLERMRTSFKTEEKYMIRYKYPEHEEHAKKHKRIVKRMVYVRKLFSDEEKKIEDTSLDYFKDWLTKHMTDDNRKFAPYYRLYKNLK